MPRPSNVLLVVTDQERAAGPYAPPEMAAFRATQLPHRARLAARGVRFDAHRIVASACVPSRASMFTGRPPAVHRMWQTDGFSKAPDDRDMRWLSPGALPTLGHCAEALGMESVYFGKWHLSHVDATGPAHADDPLAPFGFHGWVGPEPHGASPRNAGLARDPFYVEQATRWLDARGRDRDRPPFVLVVCLVNPHDLVFWPAWRLWNRRALDLRGIPAMGPAPSEHDANPFEPNVLAAYRAGYPHAYGPPGIVRALYARAPDTYRRFYASLLRRSDEHLGAMLDALERSGLADDTQVILTSDHGELLGAHGGLHQKWYNAFEEVLRVPLITAGPRTDHRAGTRVLARSDHLDLLPTILGTLHPEGCNAGEVRALHTHTLPGVDLLEATLPAARETFFETRDHILAGQRPRAALIQRFPRLDPLLRLRVPPLRTNNTAVQALIATGDDGHTRKIIRYHDPSWCPAPGDAPLHPGDEWSLFDLTDDPCERRDLAREAAHASALSAMRSRLLARLTRPPPHA